MIGLSSSLFMGSLNYLITTVKEIRLDKSAKGLKEMCLITKKKKRDVSTIDCDN